MMPVVANCRALSHAAASTSTGSGTDPPRQLGPPRHATPAAAAATDLQAIAGVGRANAALLRRRGIGSVERLQQVLLADYGGDSEQLSRFLRSDVGIRSARHCQLAAQFVAALPAPPPAPAPIKLAVEGNIGAGKSTFLGVLRDAALGGAGAAVRVVPEPVEAWRRFEPLAGAPPRNLLEEFYRDPRRVAYVFQHYVLLTRMREDRAARGGAEPLRVLERSVFSDRMVFVRAMREGGLMSDLELGVYDCWLEEQLRIDAELAPSGFVYLRAQPHTCMARLRTRARSEEVGVSAEYLERLHEQHECWLHGGSRPLREWLEQRCLARRLRALGIIAGEGVVDMAAVQEAARSRGSGWGPLEGVTPEAPASIRDHVFVLKGRAPDTNDAKIADSLRGTPVLVLDHDQEGIVRDPAARELYARRIQEFADYVRRLSGAGGGRRRDPGLLDRLDARQYDELRRLLVREGRPRLVAA